MRQNKPRFSVEARPEIKCPLSVPLTDTQWGIHEEEQPDAEVERRLRFLRQHIQDKVPLTRVASEAGVAIRTARRWLANYRATGPAGLQRASRGGVGSRKFEPELVEFIEGLALMRPSPTIATIHRRARKVAEKKRWRTASYSSCAQHCSRTQTGFGDSGA